MNIISNGNYPANKLSNFAGNRFALDDVQCNSMEGFLQSLKFKSPRMQREICKLVGYGAKKAGKHKNWKINQTLYWKGEPIKRNSKKYQDLLDKAFNAMYEQSEGFRIALELTGKSPLTHSIGRRNSKETVLTVREFCKRLTHLRDVGRL